MGAFYVHSFMNKQVVQVRKNWELMLFYLIVAIAIPFISLSHNVEYWLMALAPAAAFMGGAFYYPRIKWIPMLLHWMLVGFVLYSQYFQK